MSTKFEVLHLAAEVDVDGQLWAGIADYQGQPHLLLAELLDLDQPRARKRLGQTFFLIAVTRGELLAILKEWRASALQFDGDPTWKQKQRRWEKAWTNFKRKYLKQAGGAWRVRGSFRPQSAARRQNDCAKGEDSVRWTLLRKTPVTGDSVRARMARIVELLEAQLPPAAAANRVEELPF